ncbi:MAG: hypothetical protein LBU87_05945 [Lactobacillales bacterium]|jgi:ABC-2 type transport system permease protein|nr:hypothetical protein [Lactobacillales bacterium]
MFFSSFRKYALFFNAGVKHELSNLNFLLVRTVFYVFLIFVYNRMWLAIGSDTQVPGLTPLTATWYLAIAEALYFCVPFSNVPKIEEDVKNGQYIGFLSKPISYNGLTFFELLGGYVIRQPVFLTLAFLLAWLITGGIPDNVVLMPLILVFYLLSAIINIFFILIIGLCYFFTYDTRNALLIYTKCCLILGGILYPLDIYPEWMVIMSKATPFYAMIYLPTRMIYRTPNVSEVLEVLALLLFWIIVMGGSLFFVQRALQKKMTVSGG